MIEIVVRHRIELSDELAQFVRLVASGHVLAPMRAAPEKGESGRKAGNVGEADASAAAASVGQVVAVEPAAEAIAPETIVPAVNELAGPPVPEKSALPSPPPVATSLAPRAHATEITKSAKAPSDPLWTVERDALIVKEWPAGTSLDAMVEMLNRLDGHLGVPRDRVAIRAAKLGVKRPPWYRSHSNQAAIDAAASRPVAPEKATPTPPQSPLPTVAPSTAAAPKPAPTGISADRVPAHFIAIRDFAARNGLKYDGGNMHDVDKLCDRLQRPRYVQVAD
jgi:hypothetical protein